MGQGDRFGHGHDDEPLDPHGEGPDDDTAGPLGGPPDPLDRVWVHPTELPALAPGLAAAPPSRTATATTTSRRPMPWLVPILAGAAGALVTVGILAITGTLDRSSSNPSTGASTDAPNAASSAAAQAAARLGASVIAVTAHDARGVRRGSGVCVRHGGGLLTTTGVVGDAKSVEIVTADRKSYDARVVGRDRVTGLVLVAPDAAADIPAAQLASNPPATGTPVLVLGAPAPGTSSPWMSNGMMSSSDAILTKASGPATGGLLQTDAPTTDGATGGALLDDDGRVAGIVLGRLDTGGTTYAVPIATAVAIAEELQTSGVARHGWLGVEGIDTAYGPLVEHVAAGSPAAKAGIRAGDVVENVDGRGVQSIGDVVALVNAHAPGDSVRLGVLRGAKGLSISVVAGSSPG